MISIKTELDYKHPLASGEKFIVTLNVEQETTYRAAFHQETPRFPDHETALQAKIIGKVLGANRSPFIPGELQRSVNVYLIPTFPMDDLRRHQS